MLEETESAISEVLVHVDTSPHDASCPLQTNINTRARGHVEVERDVASLLATLPEVVDTVRVRVNYLSSGLTVEAHVRMRMSTPRTGPAILVLRPAKPPSLAPSHALSDGGVLHRDVFSLVRRCVRSTTSRSSSCVMSPRAHASCY